MMARHCAKAVIWIPASSCLDLQALRWKGRMIVWWKLSRKSLLCWGVVLSYQTLFWFHCEAVPAATLEAWFWNAFLMSSRPWQPLEQSQHSYNFSFTAIVLTTTVTLSIGSLKFRSWNTRAYAEILERWQAWLVGALETGGYMLTHLFNIFLR